MNDYIVYKNIIFAFFMAGLTIAAWRERAFSQFLDSFNNKEQGMSGRKMTAFGFSTLAAYLHVEGFDRGIIDKTNFVEILLIDVGVVMLALALIKVDDIKEIIKLKFGNGKTETKETTK